MVETTNKNERSPVLASSILSTKPKPVALSHDKTRIS